jgi:SAM-dependent methyltransferase
MTNVVRPPWLDVPPDQDKEHDYLDTEQIGALPDGAFYKRKSALTRCRFVKATLSVDGRSEVVEFVDNRGSWRIEPRMCERIAALLGPAPVPPLTAASIRSMGVPDDLDEAARWQLGVLHASGLAPLVLPMAVPPPPGRADHPRTMGDIVALYGNYTDMEAQGHFAEDSPDLERFERMVAWVPRATEVLDLGCNSGAFGVRLIAQQCRVAGVDLALDLLRTAAARGVAAIRAFAERLPLTDESFDAVICGELLEHSLDPAVILREAVRVLRPGGVLVGSIPHAAGQWGTEDLQYHKEHLWAFSPESLAELVRDAGLGEVETMDLYHGCEDPQGIVFRARKPR